MSSKLCIVILLMCVSGLTACKSSPKYAATPVYYSGIWQMGEIKSCERGIYDDNRDILICGADAENNWEVNNIAMNDPANQNTKDSLTLQVQEIYYGAKKFPVAYEQKKAPVLDWDCRMNHDGILCN